MMKRASLWMIVVAAGCAEDGAATKEVTLHKLENTGYGFMREVSVSRGDPAGEMSEPEPPPDDGGMILPDPGGECPFLEYREEHTVVIDAGGNVVSETWTFCSRCVDAEGNTIGEEVCVSEPVLPPDSYCYEYSDGISYCYECVDASGMVVDGACYPIEEPPPPPTDPFCCEARVCEVDPYCCEVAWDCRCDALAAEICGGGTDPGEPPRPPDEPPVDDCFARFCEEAPSCCEMTWDEACDARLEEICGGFGDPGDPDGMK